DLARYREGLPIAARPAGVLERGFKWARRHRMATALLGAGAAATLLLVAGVLVHDVQLQQALVTTEGAKRDAQKQLYEALVAQARANRMSRRPGQRFGTLATIQKALSLGGPSPSLRTEAIAALSLPDLEVVKELKGYAGGISGGFDGLLERYARIDPDGSVSV